MHYKIITSVCSFLLVFLLHNAYAHPELTVKDSVGIEKKAGEVFILHRVEQGETLFSISRLYGVHVDELKNSNPEININKLSVGDTLRIPMFPELFRGKKTHHVVKEGETLFRIAQQYDVSTENIRLWNAIDNQPLSIGQELIIYLKKPTGDPLGMSPDLQKYVTHTVQEGETLYAISRAYGVKVDSLKMLNRLSDESISLDQTLLIKEKELKGTPAVVVKGVSMPNTDKPESVARKNKGEGEESTEEDITESDSKERKLTRAEALEKEKERVKAIRAEEKKALSEYEKSVENGFAATIPGRTDTQKFLALHRTAPIGTIMQIRNEMNNISVFVRVVGKLPATGMNDKVTIRISQAAYEKLGGINERFPVEITYLK